jgi:hypothetical protein
LIAAKLLWPKLEIEMKFGFVAPVLLALAACGVDSTPAPQIFLASPSQSERDFAKAMLNSLQARSFAANREYCGYLMRTPDGKLAATGASKGRMSSCRADLPPEGHSIVASFHTHGAFEYDTPAEFPSVGDVEADHEEGVNGYVSTPGGRLWFVDGTALSVRQLCGVGCMIQDPNFQAGLDGVIKASYSIGELRGLHLE